MRQWKRINVVSDKKSLIWDEENLEETSKDKGTRMKIDEVETPYHYPGDYSVSGSDSESNTPHKSKTPQNDSKGNVAEEWDILFEK